MSAAPKLRFECWVVYWNPKDFPGSYVVRHWEELKPDAIAQICGTLEIARACIPEHCVRRLRMPEDDPAIYEVWL